MFHEPSSASIAISMPALNEIGNIKKTIYDVQEELKKYNYTICVVDDGSTDGTLEYLKNISEKDTRIKLLQGEKKLYGCQRGAASFKALNWLVNNTDHNCFIEMDADGQQSPDEIKGGISEIVDSNYDVAIASKYIQGSVFQNRPIWRRFVSLTYSTLAKKLIDPNIHDYSNCFRFYNRKAAELILKKPPKYTSAIYLLEILAIWISNNLKIVEIPTKNNVTENNQSKVKTIDIIKGLLGLLTISLKFHMGRFKVSQNEF
jgi:dolichol-phosphate mannosyltransferase